MDLIKQPAPGDPDRGQDVLNDVQAVMKKHSVALVVQNGSAYLCVSTPGSAAPLRAIAEVTIITPQGFNWRPFDWTKEKPQ
jgi:hypothetical protein